MSFYDNVQNTIENTAVTEKGMTGYKTTSHPLLDMNFKISSYRNKDEVEIFRDFKDILKSEDAAYALKFLFYVRDIREGLGERQLFRTAMLALLDSKFEDKDAIIKSIIEEHIPMYGRYDDLLVFLGTKYDKDVVRFINRTLAKDLDDAKNDKPITLMAKWLPSENASAKKTRELARELASKLTLSPRSYRKILSFLRGKLAVVETFTSSNKWSAIDYNAVPSVANLKYKNAFLKHDEERRRDFLAKLRTGDSSVHINGGVNFPHDIVAKYGSGWSVGRYDDALEQLWKSLKQMEGLNDTIVVRDGSGSMTCRIGTGKTTALDVSTALAIYCSERLGEGFKDKFITFSSEANLIDLHDCKSLHAKLEKCYREDDCSTTNLQSVFELILRTAQNHHLKQSDIPSQILVVSDMEFDGSHTRGWGGGMNYDNNVISYMQDRFAAAGYTMPKLVFWNVNSRTNTIPCVYNECGVLLISGFAVNTLKMVATGNTDPFGALVDTLSNKRYDNIPLLKMV